MRTENTLIKQDKPHKYSQKLTLRFHKIYTVGYRLLEGPEQCTDVTSY